MRIIIGVELGPGLSAKTSYESETGEILDAEMIFADEKDWRACTRSALIRDLAGCEFEAELQRAVEEHRRQRTEAA